MLAPEATWLAFAVFSGLRTISYVRQIVRIAKDRTADRAYPIRPGCSGPAHDSTRIYAAMNLKDIWLAVASSIYGLWRIAVIVLTMFKRLGQRRTRAAAMGLVSRKHAQTLSLPVLGHGPQEALPSEGCRA